MPRQEDLGSDHLERYKEHTTVLQDRGKAVHLHATPACFQIDLLRYTKTSILRESIFSGTDCNSAILGYDFMLDGRCCGQAMPHGCNSAWWQVTCEKDGTKIMTIGHECPNLIGRLKCCLERITLTESSAGIWN